ncbi:MAG: 3-hydroxybutyryl-CoA dehydrogenase [Flavobacteriaceae bacterium]|nr:3-hydroxybutyryl-CoA dehydrogenase [Flavobacteriaceae bacterium]
MIKNVGILGSGTMGSGIAQVAATAGCEVYVYDTNEQALEKAQNTLEKILSRLIEKGRITSEEKNNIQQKITYVTSLEDFKKSEIIIEAIIEDLAIKQSVFKELESIVSKKAILASNTSSLSIASIASALNRPKRFIGIHFFNPAPLMKLVEVIPAVQTSNRTMERTIQIIEDWGKIVAKAKDTPGFIVNRVARPFYGESLRLYEEGVASFATIDWAMKSIGGFRMGPFELMDFIGNDVNYTVTETVFREFCYDPRYKPSFTQKRMSEAGYLGRKTGKGYYNYAEGATNDPPEENVALAQKIFDRVLVMLINEAADALFLNIASAEDIDMAMTKGVNYPKGLLAWADEKGIDWCVSKLDEMYDEYHEDRYRCSPLLRKMNRENKTFF